MQKKEFSIKIGEKTLTATFSDLADQANGSVILTSGNTSVLATAVMSKNKREGIDFFPLVVDYEEKFYAAGAILGSRFMRREGRPSDEAVLSGRIVDRTIRPLFEKHIRNEMQVVITILSIDQDDPDVLAVNAASLAFATSDIPWSGPVSAVRIVKQKENNELIINPSYDVRGKENIELDAVVCGKGGNLHSEEIGINMIETGANETSEDTMAAVLTKASEEIKKLQEFQKKIIKEIGKTKQEIPKNKPSSEFINLFNKIIQPKLKDAVFAKPSQASSLQDEWLTAVKEESPDDISLAPGYFDAAVDDAIHSGALEKEERADGRKLDEVRKLEAQAGGVSPVLHGTGIFYRGGTHVLSVLTLGGPKDAQLIEGMEIKTTKRYMHHYNFLPFSVGETGRVGGMNRRMIGHGALAEKALIPVLPTKEEFPYTIRIVSESMASNGSTSMASVCGSTLALMDAGVPIKSPVAGIAIGLILEKVERKAQSAKQEKLRYKILTDIQGPEDHHGDMDLKVAGTRKGITAIQMDIKVDGIPIAILTEALEAAKKARLEILDVIEKEIKEPRQETSPAAPKIIQRKIDVDKIGMVIGSGGKTIKEIIEKTGTEIDIEDDGTVFVIGKIESAKLADKMIEEIVHEFKPGERFEGIVVKILDFGAFVKINPYADGLVHISEFAPERIDKIEGLVKVGDKVPVVVKEVDERGRLSLSIKKADEKFFSGKIKTASPQEKRFPRHTSK